MKGKENLRHNEMEWLWLALIDEIGGIPLDLTTGALLRGNPVTVGIEVQQIGAGLDLRNGIVSHGITPLVIRYD